ncbi:Uncharacterized protein TCM_004006 [Theobroma cacao]|uniref:Uncharacterized protein n=1 Tax=Theobroma cacao TaxID=3641 RepID=A0A061DPS6_THECC|nr:Uncharacterized protein TCM_004006 [Theobroma cacao]
MLSNIKCKCNVSRDKPKGGETWECKEHVVKVMSSRCKLKEAIELTKKAKWPIATLLALQASQIVHLMCNVPLCRQTGNMLSLA